MVQQSLLLHLDLLCGPKEPAVLLLDLLCCPVKPLVLLLDLLCGSAKPAVLPLHLLCVPAKPAMVCFWSSSVGQQSLHYCFWTWYVFQQSLQYCIWTWSVDQHNLFMMSQCSTSLLNGKFVCTVGTLCSLPVYCSAVKEMAAICVGIQMLILLTFRAALVDSLHFFDRTRGSSVGHSHSSGPISSRALEVRIRC